MGRLATATWTALIFVLVGLVFLHETVGLEILVALVVLWAFLRFIL